MIVYFIKINKFLVFNLKIPLSPAFQIRKYLIFNLLLLNINSRLPTFNPFSN